MTELGDDFKIFSREDWRDVGYILAWVADLPKDCDLYSAVPARARELVQKLREATE